jgi:hypothetical protein
MIYMRPTRIPLVGGFWFYFLAENMMMAAREQDRKQLTLVGWLVPRSLCKIKRRKPIFIMNNV